MAEKEGIPMAMVCWRGRLSGLKAIDVEAQITSGKEKCPKNNQIVNVIVDEGSSEPEIQKAAARQFSGKCSLCGLAPIADDFSDNIYRE